MRRISHTAIAAVALWIGTFLSPSWTADVVQAPQQQDKTIAATKLNLTMEQRYTIKEIVKGLKIDNDRSSEQVEVGKVVAKSVHLRPMPAEIAAKVSPIKSHTFFLKGEKVVIVDPKDNRIVEVID
jgi:hypothetical protein